MTHHLMVGSSISKFSVPPPVGLHDGFIHGCHRSAIDETDESIVANPYARRFGPRLRETTDQRAAIIYTMVECAKRHGHNPEAWLTDVLTRLSAMTNQDDLSVLLPSKWQPVAAATTAIRETCPA